MPADQLQLLVSPYDLKRLEQYSSNMADYHLIMDLVPNLAKIYFLYDVENLNKPHLGAIQQAILTGIGLQCKTVDTLRYSQSLSHSHRFGTNYSVKVAISTTMFYHNCIQHRHT